MEKIKLYTCKAGLELFKNGSLFSAWEQVAGNRVVAGDVAILVNSEDVVFNGYGGVEILRLDSVEIA